MRCPSAVAPSLRALRFLLLVIAFAAFASASRALTATTTALAITSAGAPASTVSSGTVVTLTATVTAGSTHVTPGLVTFCDAAAAHCNDVHIVGTAQLTSAGTAIIKFRPGLGSHSYKAVFVGTNNYTASFSTPVSLSVTGEEPSETKISQSGSPGNYTLIATVGGVGGTAPTGMVSFLDTSNGNATLSSATLGAGTAGLSLFPAASPHTDIGDDALDIVAVDLNGDGIVDLAAINHSKNTVSILLGQGDGTFTATASSPQTGQEPYSIDVGDFNGDGIPDLAVANNVGKSITILLGIGDGTFSTKTIPTTGLGPIFIHVGDFNGDGIPDLAVVTGGTSYSVAVFLGNGDGTFNAAPLLPLATIWPKSFAVADFDGDGRLDIAVVNGQANGAGLSSVAIFLGNGNGTFSATSSNPTTGRSSGLVAAGDFNGDGIPDLAVTNWNDSTVTILLGNGDGTFTETASSPSTGAGPNAIVAGDFNGDGLTDLAVADWTTESLSVLLGNGDGTFRTPAVTVKTSNSNSIEAGDFNGDGIDDLAVNGFPSIIPILSEINTAKAKATGIAVPVATGAHNVVASYDGDDYNAASTSVPTTLNSVQGTPTVSLGALPATAPYGAPLTFTSTVSGIGNVPSGTVDFKGGIAILCTATLVDGAATCQAAITKLGPNSITASYSGDTNYAAGSSTATTLTITQGTPTITWPSPAAITYGTALGSAQLNATASVAGAFVYSPVAGTILGAGQQTLSLTFTPTDTTDYTTATDSVALTVNPATPTIAWATPTAITYGTALASTQLDASCTVAGTLTYSPAAGTVLGAGSQTLSVTLTPTDATDYTIATKTVTLTVNKAPQTITFVAPASVYYGAPPITLSATGGASGSPVVFSILSGPGSLSGTNNHTLTITGTGTIVIAANQAGNTNYLAANAVTQSISALAPVPAALTSPTPGSTLSGTSATFNWTAGGGVTKYELQLGYTGPGSSNVYNASGTTTNALTTGVITVPAYGVTLYARLKSYINGAWQYNDYTYMESGTPVKAALTSPAPSGTLTGTSVTFNWTAGGGVTKYELQLGYTGPGSSNVYNASGTTTNSLTTGAITVPAYGVTLYARLKSYINGAWQYNDYTYMESGTPTKAALTSPTPGTTLTGTSVTFNWTAGGGVTKYEFQLGIIGHGSTSVYNASGTTTNSLTTGAITVPANGVTLYARLYSYINGAWQYNDYTYTESGTPTKAALTAPTPGSTLTGTSATFTWTAGGGVTKYEFELGTTGHGSSNVYNAAGTSTTALTSPLITGIPANGVTLYARLYSYINGAWQYNDYTYTESGTPVKAVLTSPTPGITLTGSSATFTWTAGGGVTKYLFELGTTGHGSSNVYNAAGTSTTALTTGVVSGIPTTGGTLYARLYSYINGAWQYNDYTYTEQ